jgi:hypothetical protein
LRKRAAKYKRGRKHRARTNRGRKKFAAKSIGWGEIRVFLEGDKLEVAVKNGRWVLTHLPAGPRPAAELLRCYVPDD